MSMTELARLSALEIAQLIRRRQLSPAEATAYFLRRIERRNPELGSFVYVDAEAALADAQAKTEQLTTLAPEDLPPFFGVPTAVKDLNRVAGMPTGYGVAALYAQPQPAPADDGIVARLREAGFILLGKTATSELGSFPYTETPGLPPARNPWNVDYTPGGSSGGASSAVAAGLIPAAHGSDGGGSLRGPAACCGLVGLKPSRGRVSNAPVGDYQSGIASGGALTQTVADSAALLDVLAGYTTGDPYWLPDPEIPFLASLERPLPRLKIAFTTQMRPFPPADEVSQRGVREAVAHLEALGHSVEEACFNAEGLAEPFKTIWQAGVGAAGIPLEYLSPVNRWLGETSGTAGEYLRATQSMQLISRQIVAFFADFDLLVLPVYNHRPPRIGAWAELTPEETVAKIIQWVAPCPPFNASGLPALSLPMGWEEDGLPYSVQLAGRPAGEATLLALARRLEERVQFSRPLI
ncbi:MAG: amidase [Cyanobacteria bacterium RI_101]|nr:amidase [Cyanobacteria bacterium RI_101]